MSNLINEFEQRKTTTTEMAITRQAQEVQAAMIIAKKFPRDEYESFNRIMRTCERKSLAEEAIYSYPRGGTMVEGPSIRLAEAIAQNWGNMDFGIIELERRAGESQAMAYAWDLETNTRSTKIFTVKHIRNTKSGSYELTDERDIYEMVANYGARRQRACILSVLPGDIVEKAVDQCKETKKLSSKDKPLEQRLQDMLQTFDSKFRVTKKDIEKYIGYSVSKMTEDDLQNLGGIYKALRDGYSKREDYFDIKNAEVKSSLTETENEESEEIELEQQELS